MSEQSAWKPDMPLCADATRQQIIDRMSHLYREAKSLGDATAPYYAVAMVDEVQAACAAVQHAGARELAALKSEPVKDERLRAFVDGLGVSITLCGGGGTPEAWKELGEFAAKLIRKPAASQGEAERGAWHLHPSVTETARQLHKHLATANRSAQWLSEAYELCQRLGDAVYALHATVKAQDP